MDYQIQASHDPSKEDIAVLLDGLCHEAHLAKGLKKMESFGFFIKEGSKVIAGIYGVSLYGCQYTDLLWVDPKYRGKGLGRKLMQKAEELGRERNCRFATVNTMDWEALPFYEGLGYNVEFKREGYDNNSTLYFLKKHLVSGGPND